MFGYLFKSKKTSTQPTPMDKDDLIKDSLMRAIEKKKKEDPMAGIKIGAKEITSRFTGAFKGEKGVHVESYFTALGALAGFSCQMALRETLINTGKHTEKEIFMTVKSKDGDLFFFGDNLNKPLAENQYSVWNIIAFGIQEAGGTLPDIHDIFSNSVKTIGSEEFGKPRVPEKHSTTSDTPQNFVKDLWPVTRPILDDFADTPVQWPIILSISLQQMIIDAKEVIPAEISGKIVMETAISMSKIDPKPLGLM